MDKTNTHNNKDEISIKDLFMILNKWWRFLLSKWLLIIGIGFLGAVIGFVYGYMQKTVYKAELSFALEDDKSGGGIGAAAGLASQLGVDLGGVSGGGVFSGDNLLELMKSRSMVEKTLLSTINYQGRQETIAELYISFNNYREDWDKNNKLKSIFFLPNTDRNKFSLQQDSILGLFYKDIINNNLSVNKVDKKLSIITVILKSKNELFSKYFTECLVKTVSDFYKEIKTKKSVQNISILQRQTDSVRSELNSAINGVASSVDRNPNPNPALQILRAPSQRRQVDVQANTVILNQLVANLEISKVTLRKETPLIQIIDSPILPLDKEKFGKAKGLLSGGVLAGILTVIILLIKKLLEEIFE